MNIKQESKNDILVCYLAGEIDINTAPQLKKTFDKLVGAKTGKIVMNFKDVSYVDSSGLATLVHQVSVEILDTVVASQGGSEATSVLASTIHSAAHHRIDRRALRQAQVGTSMCPTVRPRVTERVVEPGSEPEREHHPWRGRNRS